MSNVTRRDAMKRAAAASIALAGAGTVAAQEKTSGVKQPHDVKKLEDRVKALHQNLMKLGDGKDMEEFFTIIHKPGWTTPAEFMLVSGLLQSMNAQVKTLAGLKQVLLAGSRAVAAG